MLETMPFWSIQGPYFDSHLKNLPLGPITFLWGQGLWCQKYRILYRDFQFIPFDSGATTNQSEYMAVAQSVGLDLEEKKELWSWLTDITGQSIRQIYCRMACVGNEIERKKMAAVSDEEVLRDHHFYQLACSNLWKFEQRFLSMVSSILFYRKYWGRDATFWIEEPFLGLPLQCMQTYVKLFEVAAKERNVQIVAPTTQPMIFDWFSKETLKDTLVFSVPSPESNEVDVHRLGDLHHIEEVFFNKQDSIVDAPSHLASVGWLELAAPPH